MKVLMISTDKKILEENSAVRQRMVEYGGLVEELHIVVFAKRKFEIRNSQSETNNKIQISKNTWVYSTDSKSKWAYIGDAVKIGKQIISDTNYKLQNTKYLVTAQDPFETGMVGWRLAKKFNLPLHLQIHTDFLSPYFERESLLNKVRVLMAKFLIKRKQVKCIRVVSERIKNSLLLVTRCPLRIMVLPIFVDVKKIEVAPITVDLHKKYPQFDFIILMASRFSQEKNIPMAIEAMSEVIKKYPKAGLILVGDGPMREALKLQITNYKLQNNIILENWADDLASYYKTANLFLLTSNYEGYGMTVVEAMAAHCAVVMTDVGLAGDILTDEYSGLAVPVDDKEKIVEAILKMIENRALRENMIGSAQKTVDEVVHSKEKYLEDYKKSWEVCLLDKHE